MNELHHIWQNHTPMTREQRVVLTIMVLAAVLAIITFLLYGTTDLTVPVRL